MADWSDLKKRTLSAVVLVAVALGMTLASPLTFSLMVIFGTALLWQEWFALTRTRGVRFFILGIVYLSAAAISLIYLRGTNLNILLSVFAIVWGGDIAAYLVGKKFGKHKIAPSISPGKTWEGLLGAVLVSALIGGILGHVAPVPHAILGAVFAVVGLGGDLFESALKRHAGVKDSGKLIPGHGGLFDRVDALLPCAILAAVLLYARLTAAA